MKSRINHIVSAIYNELLYGAHIVSLGAIGIISTLLLIFKLPINFTLLSITYIIFQIIYRYNYIREVKFDIETNPERASHVMKKRRVMWLIIILYIFALSLLSLHSNIATLILVVFIVTGGILYTEYFKKLPILGFKNYYTSFFWAITVFLIPLFHNSSSVQYIYFFIFILLRGLINTIFFDIKDIDSDREQGLKTIPVYFGKVQTLYYLQVINVISFCPILIGIYIKELPIISALLVFTVINGIYYLNHTKFLNSKSIRKLSYILVDGEYILWPLLVIVGQNFIK